MEHKSNHFVPKSYQKKWYNKSQSTLSSDKDGIKILVKKTGRILVDIPKNIAQKNNLYTFPNEFKTVDNKINEKLLIKHFEDWYIEAMGASFDKNTLPNSSDAYKLASFVIIQSFRTIKFKNSNETIISKNINFKNSPQWQLKFSLHLSFLIIKGFPELIKNAKVIFYKAPTNLRFITSDNPATYWMKTENGYNYVASVAENFEIKDNPNLRIICPLNPKWCAEVVLFQKPVVIKSFCRFVLKYFRAKPLLKIEKSIKTLSASKFEKIQNMIYQSADKIIIGYDDLDLNTIYKSGSSKVET